jgi:hypothetical protein
MKSPYVVTVVSREEKLAEAARLVSQAEAQMEAWPNDLDPQVSKSAFFTYQQALSIFETAGDLSDPKFKKQLADSWMQCSIIVARLAWKGGVDIVDTGLDSLYYSVYGRAVQLYGELIGSELRTNKQLKAAWAQILHLHNHAMHALRVGELNDAERIWLEHIELLKRFDKVYFKGEGVHNPRDWLVSHFHLAFLRQMLGRSDKEVLATIDDGLAGFEPSKSRSPSALRDCHYLTQLKSEILHAQHMKKWERAQQRKEKKALTAKAASEASESVTESFYKGSQTIDAS